MKNIIIIGASGHAKVVIDIIEKENRYNLVGLIDSDPKKANTTFLGYPVLGPEEELPVLIPKHQLAGAIIAIGDNWTRKQVADSTATLAPALPFVTAVHPSAQLARGVTLGPGTVVMAGVVINTDCTIAEHCILNTHSSLDHDSQMGPYSSLAPGVNTGGNVKIGPYTAIGLSASIIHGKSIGAHSVIGASALVLDDIGDNVVAYGVPARVVGTRSEAERYL